MTSLLLLTLLNLAPGIQLADTVEGRHVALSDARIRLVSDDEETRPSIDAMTREQLTAELRRLDETKPSLVGPIVLTAVGLGLGVGGYVGISILAASLFASGSAGGIGVVLLYVGFILVGVACIVGIVLAIVGTVKLITRIIGKVKHGREVSEVQSRLDTMGSQPQLVPPPPEEAPLPLPPPPPPPQANLVVPGAMQTVMTF